MVDALVLPSQKVSKYKKCELVPAVLSTFEALLGRNGHNVIMQSIANRYL